MTRQAEGPLWPWHTAAFLIYAALSFIFLAHGASLTGNILGIASDPMLFIWFLAWWPFALVHHLNPLVTALIWQPGGLNLAWTTSIPFLAILAWPITFLSGPVLSYNLLTLAAPALSAWCAYFLCLRLTGMRSAALVGGYLYGFSSYEMAETLEHLNLDFNFILPCLLLLVLARLEGRMGRAVFILFIALLSATQFYISAEIFATMWTFGALALLLASGLMPARRSALRSLAGELACGFAAALVIAAPYLWNMLAVPRSIQIPPGWAYVSAGHFFNLLVPRPSEILADPQIAFARHDLLGIPQGDFTTGLVLLGILAHYFYTHLDVAVSKLLLIALAALLVASLGPQLWFGDHFTGIILPWLAVLHLPLIGATLPVRLALYGSLILAVVTALWIAAPDGMRRSRARTMIAVLGCLLVAAPAHPIEAAPLSVFFQPGKLQAQLGPDARLLVLPDGRVGLPAFWQAENGFGFHQSTGYVGFPPRQAVHYPVMNRLMFGRQMPDLDQALAAFCIGTGTDYVIAGPGAAADFLEALRHLHWPERRLDDVIVFTVLNNGAE